MNWRRLPVWWPRAWLTRHRGWRHRIVVSLSGAVSALSMAPLHVWPALMLGLCVLLWSFDGARRTDRPLRSALLRGFLFGMGYFLAGTYWVVFAFLTRGNGFELIAPLAMPPFAALLAVFWGAAGVVYVAIAQRTEWRVLVFAASIALLEWVRGHLFGGLPWNLPGYTWEAGGAISQAAAWFGIYGLSFLTVLVLAAPAVVLGARFRVTRAVPVFAALAVALVLVFTGALRLFGAQVDYHPDVRLRIVQSALTQQEKWGPGGDILARSRYLALTEEPGLENVTHVLWPEGALPIFMLRDGATLSMIGERLDRGQVLMAGINRLAEDDDGRSDVYNSMAVLHYSDGTPRLDGLYDKARLTPFGETVPLSWLVSAVGFDEFARRQFTPGAGPFTLDVPNAPPVMPLICYEVIFPEFVAGARSRPQWLFNLSNDAWFGTSTGPYQHFNQARYRSIETGLPLVRAASRGVSGVVDPFGRADVAIAPEAEGAFDVALPRALGAAPYSWWGDWPALLLILAVLAGSWLQAQPGWRERFRLHP